MLHLEPEVRAARPHMWSASIVLFRSALDIAIEWLRLLSTQQLTTRVAPADFSERGSLEKASEGSTLGGNPGIATLPCTKRDYFFWPSGVSNKFPSALKQSEPERLLHFCADLFKCWMK